MHALHGGPVSSHCAGQHADPPSLGMTCLDFAYAARVAGLAQPIRLLLLPLLHEGRGRLRLRLRLRYGRLVVQRMRRIEGMCLQHVCNLREGRMLLEVRPSRRAAAFVIVLLGIAGGIDLNVRHVCRIDLWMANLRRYRCVAARAEPRRARSGSIFLGHWCIHLVRGSSTMSGKCRAWRLLDEGSGVVWDCSRLRQA
jgi:hypothetical protein